MRGVARPVLAAGLSGACWAELGRAGKIGRARGKGGGGGLGHFARAAGLLGGFGSGWGSGFHSLLFFKPLKPI